MGPLDWGVFEVLEGEAQPEAQNEGDDSSARRCSAHPGLRAK